MTVKPSYEELERRVQELEKIESELEYCREALGESEDLFKRLYEKAPLGYQSLDENGHFIVVNQTWLDNLGYIREEVLGKSFSKFLHPDWRDHFKENFVPVEIWHVDRNGREFPMLMSGVLIKNQNDKPECIAASAIDMSAHHQEEAKLVENEGILRDIVESTLSGFWDWNLVDNTEYLSPTFKRMFGYEDHEMENSPEAWQKIIFPEDLPGVLEVFDQHVKSRGRKPFYNEIRYRHRDGSTVWVICAGRVIEWADDGTAIRMAGCHIDITKRKRAEEALKESEQFLQILLESLPLPVFYKDVEGRYKGFNNAFETFFGRPRSELIGCSVFDINPPELAMIYHAKDAELFEKISTQFYESRVKNACGELRDVVFHKATLTNTSGAITGLVGAIMDITERKESEESLAESEARFKALHNASFGGIAIHDQGVILECNQGLSEMTGYEYSELIGMNGLMLIAKRSLKTVMNNIRTGYEKPYEAFGLRKNGEEFPIQLEARNVPYKGKQVRTVEFRDITERKRAEEDLRESEENLQALFSAMTEMVVLHELLFDDNGIPCNYRILDCNQAFSRITKIKKEKAVGKTATQVYNTDSTPYLDVYAKVALSGEPVEFVDYYAPMDKHFLISAVSPRKNFFATITSDITEIRRAEAEREKLQTQLTQAQKMESIGRLAGGVAHDFNNMLGVILGHVELALEETEDNHDLHADLKEIQNAAKHSADITKQLLAFARKQTISPRQLDLNDTVESMLKMLRRLIGENIDLLWQPAARLWPVKMDPSQIDQILANLCVNARDAISRVGKLTIETGKQTFDDKYCSEHPGFIPGDFVLLAVSDNGCGMDKDTLDNLFEPFFTTKEVGKGTGLGLATIYGIVKQNNGFINVFSEPGQGSVFKIYLPRIVADEDADKSVSVKKTAPSGTGTILLVEDEPSILRMIRMMLKRKGYTVLSAATPTEAFEKAKNHTGSIDLLMTDVVMPKMNGRDLAEKITDIFPDIRLLFMSGYTADVIANHGILDEGVAFIQKPFSMANLAEKLRVVLNTVPAKTQG
jgi:PAS domain S-box-containing protein